MIDKYKSGDVSYETSPLLIVAYNRKRGSVK